MSAPKPFRVGTRASPLALAQTEEVLRKLRTAHPNAEFETVTITTGGDKDQRTPLASLGRGMFVKELETALLKGRIDFAVHSAKDVPSTLPNGLVIAAIAERADPRDVLVNRWRLPLRELPPGARLGTSSPRRTALVLSARRDLKALPIRGNVGTRLDKAAGAGYDGVVLAAAGLLRLGRQAEVSEYLDSEWFTPDAGQGALAVEARADDRRVLDLLASASHEPSALAIRAERAFVAFVGGGCTIPVAAYALVQGTRLRISALAAMLDGSRIFRAQGEYVANWPEDAGRHIATKLLDSGAKELLSV
jgi:hydroxymethylbilane synthase